MSRSPKKVKDVHSVSLSGDVTIWVNLQLNHEKMDTGSFTSRGKPFSIAAR